MDDAFRGRWNAVIDVPADPRVHHFTGKGVSDLVARAVCRWWHKAIKPKAELATIITPRVLEYIAVGLTRIDQGVKDGKIDERDERLAVDSLFKHHLLSAETTSTQIPQGMLIAILQDLEEHALTALRDDNKNITDIVNEMKADPRKSKEAATTIADATRKTGGKIQIPPAELEQYSQIILALSKEDALTIIHRPNIATYYNTQNEAGALKPKEKKIFDRFKIEIPAYAQTMAEVQS